jgi:hypothetical protein
MYDSGLAMIEYISIKALAIVDHFALLSMLDYMATGTVCHQNAAHKQALTLLQYHAMTNYQHSTAGPCYLFESIHMSS